jgi:hypothetical protein
VSEVERGPAALGGVVEGENLVGTGERARQRRCLGQGARGLCGAGGDLAAGAEWTPRWIGSPCGAGPGDVIYGSVMGLTGALVQIEHVHLSNSRLKPPAGDGLAADGRPRSPAAA